MYNCFIVGAKVYKYLYMVWNPLPYFTLPIKRCISGRHSAGAWFLSAECLLINCLQHFHNAASFSCLTLSTNHQNVFVSNIFRMWKQSIRHTQTKVVHPWFTYTLYFVFPKYTYSNIHWKYTQFIGEERRPRYSSPVHKKCYLKGVGIWVL